MGLSAPSLYNTYGDKHALFVQALERYLDHSTRARIERLEKSLPPKQAIRRFIEEIIERSVNDRERRGCFLINSALEVAPHDSELSALIADRLAEIETFFRRSIKAAQAEGAVPRDRIAKDLARLLLGPLFFFLIRCPPREPRPMIDLYYWITPNCARSPKNRH